jgi:hypothetical protein
MKRLQMNIPHAADARRSIEEGEYEKAKQQSAIVESEILKAITDGKRSATGSGSLEPPVEAKLREMGYKCESVDHRNETNWRVTW